MKRSFLLSILLLSFASPGFWSFGQSNPPAAVELGTRGVSNFIARMEKERKVHVAFLGGSITQKDTGHVKKVSDWLKENWPDVEFTVTNAGLSSTCSLTGAFRVDRDLLSKGRVDLLIVEFAVNDDQDAGHDRKTAIRGLEGIIRQYFRANPEGDVISVQFVNPPILEKIQAGETAVSVAAHKDVARHYGLAIADVAQGLANEIAAGRMTWEEDYKGTHPNDKGYEFASGLITRIIEDSVSAETPQIIELPAPLDSGSYSGATAMDPQDLAWLGGWKWAPISRELLPVGQIRADYEKYHALRSDEAGNYVYGAFSGTMIGAFVLAGPDAGIVEVSIDAGEWNPIDLYHHYSGGLNYPRSMIFADDLSNQFHTFALRVADEKNPASKGNTATILQFQVNR